MVHGTMWSNTIKAQYCLLLCTVTYKISVFFWHIGDTSFLVYLKQQLRDLTGNAFNPLFCNFFLHIIYLIKKGFEIIGECLCMVINIELGSVNTSGGLVIRP